MQNQSGDSVNNKISEMDWRGGGGAGVYHGNVCRFGSSSSQTSQNSGDICRICHCESEPQNPLLTPCYCSGSLKYVHQSCLQQWLTASETTSCELCKFPFIMHTKIKPFNEWRALQMSGIERRRLFCSVLFHCAAATCVIWSLCVLIERATEEVKRGLISWPFWTKLVVVTVGLTGGVVFMYIQCKAYLSLCTRWRARNRILLIQNAPEKVAPPPQEPTDLRDSPPIMFNRPTAASVGGGSTGTPGRLSNTSGMGTQVSTMALNRSVYSAASHGQIVANIESNSSQMSGGSRQSRDWTNVYVEDMAFHAPSGGGGEDAEGSSKGVSGGINNVIFKGHQMHHLNQQYPSAAATATATVAPPSTAIFVENQDILSDTQPEICSRRLFDEHQLMQQQMQQQRHLDQEHFPSRSKFNRQRHSVWVDSGPMMVMNTSTATNHNQSDFRRYSDTRLVMEPQDYEHQQQIFNVACQNNSGHSSTGRVMMGGGDGGSVVDIEDNPQITDILFESAEHGSSFDPLELNIQELLELDIRTNVRGAATATVEREADEFRSSQLSVNSDPQKYFKGGDGQRRVDRRVATQAEQKHLLTPQSLPNLSASSEDLFQQQRQQQQQQQQQKQFQ